MEQTEEKNLVYAFAESIPNLPISTVSILFEFLKWAKQQGYKMDSYLSHGDYEKQQRKEHGK